MTRQAVSQHLDELERAGLVQTRRRGRYKFHDLRMEALETLLDRWVKHPRGEKS
jgi:DNA-binding transcriptional ArsR family regulator